MMKYVVYLYNDMNFTGFLFCRTTVFFISRKVSSFFLPRWFKQNPSWDVEDTSLGTAERCVIFSFRNPNHSCWNQLSTRSVSVLCFFNPTPTTILKSVKLHWYASFFPRVWHLVTPFPWGDCRYKRYDRGGLADDTIRWRQSGGRQVEKTDWCENCRDWRIKIRGIIFLNEQPESKDENLEWFRCFFCW